MRYNRTEIKQKGPSIRRGVFIQGRGRKGRLLSSRFIRHNSIDDAPEGYEALLDSNGNAIADAEGAQIWIPVS